MLKAHKRYLLDGLSTQTFRCAWYFFRLMRTGETYADPPGSPLRFGWDAP